MMARRLKTIAKYINENCNGLSAHVERAYFDTDGLVNDDALRPVRFRVDKKPCAVIGVDRQIRFVVELEDEGGDQGDHDLLPSNKMVGLWVEIYGRTL